MNVEETMGASRPTQGVRIVEFEQSSLNINGKSISVDIELWDCSGDHRYNHILKTLDAPSIGAIFYFILIMFSLLTALNYT